MNYTLPLLTTAKTPTNSVPKALAKLLAMLLMAVAVWSPTLVCADETAKKPNIILIMADDIGYECFGCYGSKQYSTPNIDKLAANGLRFNHCYAQPLCTPSRVKLMTGMSNVRNYSAFSILPRNQKTIGHYFQEAGYKTFVGGKWQLFGAQHYGERFRGKGTLPEDAGFDEHVLWQVKQLGSRYPEPLLTINGENKQFGKDDYGPQIVADGICKFMEANKDESFFVYYPMILVHNPFVTTPDSENDKQGSQKNFEDMVAYMDKLVGQIVAKTEELKLADNTLILFTGDNGTNRSITSKLNGETIRGGKGSMTDAGTRVPLVAYGPGIVKAKGTCDGLVEFSDYLPTLLSVIGAETPAGLDGQSFAAAFVDGTTPRDSIFIYYNPRPERTKPSRFARDQEYKLYGDGRLYHVATDVLEQKPVKPDSSEAATAARKKLQAKLDSMPAEGQMLLQFPDAK